MAKESSIMVATHAMVDTYHVNCLQILVDKFLIQGVKINTPHYLAKIEGITKGTSTYAVIVSQLESLSTIYYTLRVNA